MWQVMNDWLSRVRISSLIPRILLVIFYGSVVAQNALCISMVLSPLLWPVASLIMPTILIFWTAGMTAPQLVGRLIQSQFLGFALAFCTVVEQ